MRKRLSILLLLALPAWTGDQEVAKFLFDKGKKEFRAKRYDKAEEFFRRALAEHTPYPEASYEHGQALEKLGRSQEAADAYQTCIAAVNGAEKPSAKWKGASRRAGRALTKLRKEFAALDGVNRKFVKKFSDLGKRLYKTNPKWARRAFETVLAIDPTHASAKAYMADLEKKGVTGTSTKTGAKKGKTWGKQLIRSDSLKGWDPGATDHWSIDGDVITGDAEGRSGQINWLERAPLSGQYSLRCRLRLLQDRGSRRTVGLFIGDGKDGWWAIMLETNNTMTLYRSEGSTNTAVASRSIGKKDLSTWHSLRVEVSKDTAEIFFDDKQIIEAEVRRSQPWAGMMGFFVQDGKIEFKDLELKK
ncbi:MAG: tetratricopeptide repeat protein [Planctomycetota bacterium]